MSSAKAKKKRGRRGGAKPINRRKRFLGFLLRLSLLVTLLLSCIGNFYVHQPESFRNRWQNNLPHLFEVLENLGNASADITDSLGLTGRDVSVPVDREILDPDSLVCGGYPRPLKGGPKLPEVKILERTGFVVGYAPELRHPLWVAYRASPRVLPSKPPKRPSDFKRDPEAPNSPESREYSRSGYDRGHCAPNHAIARRYGKKGQLETFLTSNICPQRPDLNQGPWRDLEYRISEFWPQRYGSVWVIVGAFSGGRRLDIPGTGVDIPSGFYQIAVTLHDKEIRAFAVYMTQKTSRKAYPRAYLVSIGDLEKLTGLDFLSDLPDEIESRLESGVATRLWPSGFSGVLHLFSDRHLKFLNRVGTGALSSGATLFQSHVPGNWRTADGRRRK